MCDKAASVYLWPEGFKSVLKVKEIEAGGLNLN